MAPFKKGDKPVRKTAPKTAPKVEKKPLDEDMSYEGLEEFDTSPELEEIIHEEESAFSPSSFKAQSLEVKDYGNLEDLIKDNLIKQPDSIKDLEEVERLKEEQRLTSLENKAKKNGKMIFYPSVSEKERVKEISSKKDHIINYLMSNYKLSFLEARSEVELEKSLEVSFYDKKLKKETSTKKDVKENTFKIKTNFY